MAENGAGRRRPCSHCGYDGPYPEAELGAPRDSMPSFAGARAKLATATQDLFRLSGNHSLPVEATAVSAPPAPSVPEPVSSNRKPEASMMFSLEALMRSTQQSPKRDPDEASDQLWSMQSSEPIFGTANDEALLTTPFKMEPAQSLDSMTLSSHTPNGRRWWPIVLAASAGLALAGGGIYVFGANGTPPVSAATPSLEQAALVAQPLAEPAAAPVDDQKAAAESAAAPGVGAKAAEEPAVTGAAATEEVSKSAPSEAVGAASDSPANKAGAGSTTLSAKVTSPVSSSKVDAVRKKAPRVEKQPSAPPQLTAAFAFDKTAAKSALNDAAQAAASCGAGGAPAKGKVQVTFAPTGKVSDAQLVEGPFAGTTAGKCALRTFKAAKVPAFSGAPITVAKSFKVD
jgi:hypothetical protein